MALLPSCLALLIILVSTCSGADLHCFEGWNFWNGSCYNYGESAVSWGDALDVCRVSGGKLAEVESASENSFLKDMLQKKQSDGAWIGGTDILSQGQWEWISSGARISFTDWATGQPDAYTDDEDCIHYLKSADYKWNDYSCSENYNFICEAEALN